MKTRNDSPALERLFDDLINGNLTDAKRQAKRHSALRIIAHAREVMGWPPHRALKAAEYLKEGGSFQEYCDADRADDSGESWERMATGGDSGPAQPSFD
jgi:hypothetical protein